MTHNARETADQNRYPRQNHHHRRSSCPKSRWEIQNEPSIPKHGSNDQDGTQVSPYSQTPANEILKMLEQDQPVRDGVWTRAEIELINEKVLSSLSLFFSNILTNEKDATHNH